MSLGWVRRTAWAALTMALAVRAGSASAVVLPAWGVRNGPVIPANGALVLDEELVSVTVSLGGTPIAGTLTREHGYLIWRPSRALALGTYTVTTEAPPGFGIASTDSIQVVSSVVFPTEVADVTVDTEVHAAEASEVACCRTDEHVTNLVRPCVSTPSTSVPCSAPPEPYCPAVRFREAQSVRVDTASSGSPELVSQFLLRIAVPPEDAMLDPVNGRFLPSRSVWFNDFDPSEEQYCVGFESWNVAENRITPFEACFPNPGPGLTDVEIEPTFFASISQCHLPPDGYVAPWCSFMVQECVDLVAQTTGPEYEYRVAACEHFYSLCNYSVPGSGGVPSAGTGGTPGTGSGGSGQAGPTAGQPTAGNGERPSRTAKGCQVIGAGSGTESTGWLLALVPVIVAMRRRRRDCDTTSRTRFETAGATADRCPQG